MIYTTDTKQYIYGMRKSSFKEKRYIDIVKLRNKKNTLSSIALKCGVSTQRIQQILGNTGNITRKIYKDGFRRCYGCKRTLSTDSFYNSKSGKNINRCIKCAKKYSVKYSSVYYYKYQKGGKYYEAVKARQAVYQAIKRGEIKKGLCVVGGDCKGRIEAHHPNGYGKDHYLDIEWYCSKHHPK